MGRPVNTLFIETATPLCAIALGHGDVIEVRELDRDRRHVEALTPGIEALLRERAQFLPAKKTDDKKGSR